MKICVVSTGVFIHPPVGYSGLEMISWHTAKGLAEKGHEVSLVAPEGSTCPNVEIIPCGPPGTWDEKTSFSKYWQELLKADCIIDGSWNKWSYILKAEGRLKAPCLAVLHAPVDTMYKVWPPHFGPPLYEGLQKIEKACAVCISEDQRRHFEALHGVEARTCYNGIDVDFYKPLNIPRTKRFLFLARFSSIKGPHLAIEACKKAGVGLDLVGDTSITNEPEYLQQCKQQCDGQQIRMVGPCSRGESVYWYSQAHAMIHPNRDFREPFGLAPLEGMACGVPCIAWNKGAMTETVDNGRTGLLVRSEEELLNAVNQFSIYCTMEDMGFALYRKQCREWVADNFTVQRMVNRYEELCIDAVDTGGW